MTSTGYHVQFFATACGEPVRWRLLSGNNREVGRSADVFPDVASCHEAVTDTRISAGGLVVRLRRAEAQRWRWELHHDGVPVVLAGHTFDRQIRCEMGARQFLEHFASSMVRPALVVSGARRWGTAAS